MNKPTITIRHSESKTLFYVMSPPDYDGCSDPIASFDTRQEAEELVKALE